MPIYYDVSIGSLDSIGIQSLDALSQYTQLVVIFLDQFVVGMCALLPSGVNLGQVILGLL